MPLEEKDIEQIRGLITAGLAEALAPVQTEIAKQISGAVARATKDMGKTLDGKLGELGEGKTVAQLLADVQAAGKGGAKDGDQDGGTGGGAGAGGGGAGKASDKPNPEVIKLREDLDKLNKKWQQSEEEKEAIKRKAAEDQEDGILRGEISKYVTDPRLQKAAFLMVKDAKHLSRNEDGSLKFTLKKKLPGGTVSDVDYDVEAGVKEWSGSEDAKPFLPPKDASGTGDRSGARAGGGGDQFARNKAAGLAALRAAR